MTALHILAELAPCLAQAGIRYRIGGSVASSIWGDPRQTNDIDLAAIKSTVNEARLRGNLPTKFLIGPNEIAEALADPGEYPSFQILDMEEAFKFDVFLVDEDPYTVEEFDRVRSTEVLPGVSVPLAAPEDIILHKLRWFVSGGKVSDRQWNDIVRVTEVQQEWLDLAYLRRWATYFQLSDLLADALSQAESEP